MKHREQDNKGLMPQNPPKPIEDTLSETGSWDSKTSRSPPQPPWGDKRGSHHHLLRAPSSHGDSHHSRHPNTTKVLHLLSHLTRDKVWVEHLLLLLLRDLIQLV